MSETGNFLIAILVFLVKMEISNEKKSKKSWNSMANCLVMLRKKTIE